MTRLKTIHNPLLDDAKGNNVSALGHFLFNSVRVGEVANRAKENPNKGMQLSESGYGFIKAWEGFESKMYDLKDGGFTIGYGYHIPLGDKKKFIGGITETEASVLMHKIMGRYENQVNKYITVRLTQQQFDALVSLAYNLRGGLKNAPSLVKAINNGAAMPIIRDMWGRYSMPNNPKFHRGLLNRRLDEFEIWERGDYKRDKMPAKISPKMSPEINANEPYPKILP